MTVCDRKSQETKGETQSLQSLLLHGGLSSVTCVVKSKFREVAKKISPLFENVCDSGHDGGLKSRIGGLRVVAIVIAAVGTGLKWSHCSPFSYILETFIY